MNHKQEPILKEEMPMKRKKRSRLLCLMAASILAAGCVAGALMPGGTAHAVELA